ncbi:Serine/threonine protein kinase [Gigaspora margarita]|uniref:Serine/threonine protein kinase n=1 Tax=Gigaspora margarita TaxID=4874 RepID=A0A8H4EN22_GIGMA|nr:Serine/threonine protein kinase [Gigaspora margarita]
MENYNVPFIDHLGQTNTEENKTPFAVFSPKGVRHKPNSKEQLIKALHCVLTALKFLHEIDIMHRDFRWDNVLRFIDQDRWFIIDFDDACHTPSDTPNTQLARGNHAPEVFQPNHDESVDIWSVGYLIMTALVDVQELNDYARTKLMAKQDLDRPTAKEALKWLWNNYRDILRGEFLEEVTMNES